jgi:hypothetical protein
MVLMLTCLFSYSDWTPKYLTLDSELFLEEIHYLSATEAYASNGGGYIFHTENNWEAFEIINCNIPGTQRIDYLEMDSKTNGILVTRSTMNSDSVFVYFTTNGCYKWSKVYTCPIPNPPIVTGSRDYKVLYDKYKDNLYLILGDVISYGSKTEQNWKSVRTGVSHYSHVSSFKIYNDSIWGYRHEFSPIYSLNKGLNWVDYPVNFHLGDQNSNLGNGIQRVLAGEIQENVPNTNEWKVLFKKNDVGYAKSLQLSSRFLLLEYWYWPENRNRHSVYDYESDVIIDLDTLSDFFEIKSWKSRGDNFVRIQDGVLYETTDFGQHWSAITQEQTKEWPDARFMSVKDSTAVTASRNGRFSYTLDNGNTWNTMESPIGQSISYDNESKLYLRTYLGFSEIQLTKDTMIFEPRHFTYNRDSLTLVQITDKDELYVLAMTEDSCFILKNSTNDHLEVVSLYKNTQYGNFSGLLIQNEKYVVADLCGELLIYNKIDHTTKVILRDLVNGYQALRFRNTNSLFYHSLYKEMGIVNLETEDADVVEFTNDFVLRYGMPWAAAINSSGQILFTNISSLWVSDSLFDFKVDNTFNFTDYLFEINTWNETFWVAGTKNIYKNEKNAFLDERGENPCLQLQSMWPNPFSRKVKFRYKILANQKIRYEILNSLGQLIMEESLTRSKGLYEETIQMENVKDGIYFVKIYTDCGTEIFKIVSQKR